MDRKTFTEKLNPFFTIEQIEHLNREALESAIDAHGETIERGAAGKTDFSIAADREELHDIGRDFICEVLCDNADDRAFVEQLAGGKMVDENYSAFLEQIDNEW